MTPTLAYLGPILKTHLVELSLNGYDRVKNIDVKLDVAELHCQLAQVDRLACEVKAIVVAAAKCQHLSTEELQAIADDLSGRLTYLEEGLAVLEVDRQTPEVQIRSVPPRAEANALGYFEVLVGRHGISLRRFRKAPGEPRQSIPATLTQDVFCRVCSDLIAAIA